MDEEKEELLRLNRKIAAELDEDMKGVEDENILSYLGMLREMLD